METDRIGQPELLQLNSSSEPGPENQNSAVTAPRLESSQVAAVTPYIYRTEGGALRYYLESGNRQLLKATLALAGLAHGLTVSTSVILSHWVDEKLESMRLRYLQAFGFVCLTVVGAHFIRFTCHYRTALHASNTLHNRMFRAVTHAPLAFFERMLANGQLTNRFATDTEKVDAELPLLLAGLLDGLLSIGSGLLVVVFAAPPFVLALPLLGTLYLRTARRYRGPATALKRLENHSRGPVIGSFEEAQRGLASIRAYRLLDSCCAENIRRENQPPRERISLVLCASHSMTCVLEFALLCFSSFTLLVLLIIMQASTPTTKRAMHGTQQTAGSRFGLSWSVRA